MLACIDDGRIFLALLDRNRQKKNRAHNNRLYVVATIHPKITFDHQTLSEKGIINLLKRAERLALSMDARKSPSIATASQQCKDQSKSA